MNIIKNKKGGALGFAGGIVGLLAGAVFIWFILTFFGVGFFMSGSTSSIFVMVLIVAITIWLVGRSR